MNPVKTLLNSRRIAALLSVSGFVLVAGLDQVTGYEFIFSAAYLVPIAICAWHFGKLPVVVMSVAAGTSTWFSDLVSGKPYATDFGRSGNSLTCFVIFLTVGLVLAKLRKALMRQTRANEELERALEELRRSTEEMRRLQESSQVICAWTKQIKVGDDWMTPEEFLSTYLNIKLSHGISPEALQEIEKSIGGLVRRHPPAPAKAKTEGAGGGLTSGSP